MSYTPTEWKTGDIVSSQRLNKLEEGVKNAYEVMVINGTVSTSDRDGTVTGVTLQAQAGEIFDAAMAGIPLFLHYTDDSSSSMCAIDSVYMDAGNNYSVDIKALGVVLSAQSASDHPTYSPES